VRNIELGRMWVEGFKSFTDTTEIAFSPDAGLKFLGGRNLVEPSLGANGAGKSSCWDAICWCFYGVTPRGHRASDLSAWDAKRHAHVMVKLIEDGTEHRLLRSSHPERLLLDEQPAEQVDFDRIIGMGRASFFQSVIFGQSHPLFYDLPVPQRGALLDEILDLELWLRLSTRAAERARTQQTELDDRARNIAFLRGQMKALPDKEELQTKADEWDDEQQDKIEEAIEAVNRLEKQEVGLDKAVATLEAQINTDAVGTQDKGIAAQKKDIDSLTIVCAKHDFRLADIARMSRFYTEHDRCPECRRPLPSEFVDKQLATMEKERELTRAQITATNKLITQHRKALADMQQERQSETDTERELAGLRGELRGVIRQLEREEQHVKDLLYIRKNRNPFTAELATLADKRRDLQTQLRGAVAEHGRTEASLGRMDYWKSGFKRVRLFEIGKVLQRLELETANAAESLGLIGWRIGFQTETETKSGSTRHGVQITVTTGDGDRTRAWSPGELQRVRLAITLGLAHFIQEMAGVTYRFEVWDEPTSWLSEEGIEDLLETLAYRANSAQRSVWIIDHRSFDKTAFDEIWTATKTLEGTTVSMEN
jgi:DNA repair exonuclease SbcCD ATPase subunit